MSDEDEGNGGVKKRKPCTVCSGTLKMKCTLCHGEGVLPDPKDPNSYIACPNGKDGDQRCDHCHLTGWEP